MLHPARGVARTALQQRSILPLVATGEPGAVGQLHALLEDWRRHLRAKNRTPATISSYLTVGHAFDAHLASHQLPRDLADLRRGHVEAYLADLTARVSAATAATAAKH